MIHPTELIAQQDVLNLCIVHLSTQQHPAPSHQHPTQSNLTHLTQQHHPTHIPPDPPVNLVATEKGQTEPLVSCLLHLIN